MRRQEIGLGAGGRSQSGGLSGGAQAHTRGGFRSSVSQGAGSPDQQPSQGRGRRRGGRGRGTKGPSKLRKASASLEKIGARPEAPWKGSGIIKSVGSRTGGAFSQLPHRAGDQNMSSLGQGHTGGNMFRRPEQGYTGGNMTQQPRRPTPKRGLAGAGQGNGVAAWGG